MQRIAIVVAMDKEFALLEDLLDERTERTACGMRICTGRMAGAKQVCLMKSGIGKVAAATGINWLMFNYKPEAVINSGVAGGVGAGLTVGDMVAGSACMYHDADCGEGNDPGQIQGFPTRFQADGNLLRAVESAAAEIGLSVRKGLICTGDQFITDSARLRGILQTFPDTLAVDMESAAMAHVCHMWQIPFLSMRIISDTPCAENDNMQQYKDFWTQAPRKNFELVRSLLQSL